MYRLFRTVKQVACSKKTFGMFSFFFFRCSVRRMLHTASSATQKEKIKHVQIHGYLNIDWAV